MTARLALTCRLAPSESVPSFVSRLAVRNRVGSAREFCLDMGLTFQACVDGEPAALGKLATLTGVPVATLKNASIRRDGNGFNFCGVPLTTGSVRRARVHICPSCVGEDIVAAKGGDEPAPYGRTEWLLSVFRACPKHGCALVEVATNTPGGPHKLHDFALNVKEHAAAVMKLVAAPVPRSPSSLEAYVRARLSGLETGAPWLDEMELCATVTTCEMLGALATVGAAAKPSAMSEEDWHRAGDAGCAIVRGGEAGIRHALKTVHRAHQYGRSGREGPHTVFGFFFEWLAHDQKGPAFEPLRELLRRYIMDAMPVGPGDLVIDRVVEKRVLHSIRTASCETGRHPKRLRKVLAAAGIVPVGHEEVPDHLVVFDAERANAFLLDDTEGLSLKKVETYLNTGRVHARLLAENGFIRPFVSHRGSRDRERATYSCADLDAFLARLFDGAELVEGVRDHVHPIPAAAKRANCTAAEIIQLILDKKLRWTGRQKGVAGYLSVLVNVSEIKAHVHRPAYEGVTARAAEKILQTSTAVLTGLIREGFLPRRTEINPINRCPVDIIGHADLETFRETYVSLSQLAVEKGEHPHIVKRRLGNLAPAIRKERVGATFYYREQVQAL